LLKLRVFSPAGEIIYSTDPNEIGIVNEDRYFREVVARGSTYTKVVRKNQLSMEGERLTADAVEFYIPIMRGCSLAGVLELYQDITSKQKALEKLVS
jgi:hypothetical protein